ncbi:MAG TPA: GGDEF domain-containing protein, partial [Elusimicrobia bacterium]|nr:GGDEF domain-containing protein [Elusimicrobiota bacterium]
NKVLLLLVSYTLALFLGIIDYTTGTEIIFPLLYLIPISLVAWFTGKQNGVFISIVSGMILFTIRAMYKIPYSDSLIILWRSIGRVGIFLIYSYILSELKKALEYEKEISRIDTLTKAINRRAFYELADNEISRLYRYKHPFTVAYIDVDNFKLVNDIFGHRKGDQLLQSIVNIIQKNIRNVDTLARLGGDEFIILLPETGSENAKITINRIQKFLLDFVQDKSYPVTFSIGVVTFLDLPKSVDEVMNKTDEMMYSAKKLGKNTVKYAVVSGNVSKVA